MKIKIKDEMNDIRLKVSHQELILILDALEEYDYDKIEVDDINRNLFDKDEFEDNDAVGQKLFKMIKKICCKLENINPW